MMQKDRKPIRNPIFKTTIRGTEIIIRDRKGRPLKIINMRRYINPLIYEEADFRRNPEKETVFLAVDRNHNRLEVFFYRNKPDLIWLSVNGAMFRLTDCDWRKFHGCSMKIGKILGVLK